MHRYRATSPGARSGSEGGSRMAHDASWLRAFRQSIPISLRELARRTEINSGRLSIIERGVEPTPEERTRILAALEAAKAAPASAEIAS